jgi:TRAP-type C4-dicarboxylate transport system substrate-binding protein
MLAIDGKVFDRIKPDDRKIVREVMGAVFRKLDEIDRADNESARSALLNQGMELVHPDAAEQDSWESIAQQGRERMISRAHFTPALVEEMLGYIQEYRAPHTR